MVALTDLFRTDILDLMFTNVAAPNVGDAAGLLPSAAAGTWAIALHTGNTIGQTSTVQTQAEAAYTGYVRQTVVRTTSGWTVVANLVDNDSAITYPISTSGPETETDVSLGGFNSSEVMQIFGSLTADLVVNNGVTPQFAAGALDITVV